MSEVGVIVTLRDVIREVPGRFRSHHGHDPSARAMWKPGWTRGQIIDALDALDLERASASEVNEVVGNSSWASLTCDVCSQEVDRVLRIGEEPDHQARWQDVCEPCLKRAVAQIQSSEPTP